MLPAVISDGMLLGRAPNMNAEKSSLEMRADELLRLGFCVGCVVKSMRGNGYQIVEATVRHLAREQLGAFHGHCIRCQSARAIR